MPINDNQWTMLIDGVDYRIKFLQGMVDDYRRTIDVNDRAEFVMFALDELQKLTNLLVNAQAKADEERPLTWGEFCENMCWMDDEELLYKNPIICIEQCLGGHREDEVMPSYDDEVKSIPPFDANADDFIPF